jgi:ATP/maltotriose-dependent transcriptional regulator MalT
MVLITFGATGHFDEGLGLVEGVFEDDDLEVWSTELLVGRGVLRVYTEDVEGARRDLERVRSITRERGPFVDFLISLFYRSDLEYRIGRWDDAVTYGELAASVAEDANQPWVLALVHGVAAFPLASRGEWEPAQRHASRAREAAEQLGDLAAKIWAAMAQGRLAHARRDFNAMVDAFAPLLALEHTEGLWDPGIQPWEALYAESLIHIGRMEEGEAVLGRLEARLGETGLPSARADAARVRGMIRAANSRDDEATAAFERSLEIVRTIERPFLEGRNELAYGEFLRRRGKRGAASEHLLAARERFERLRARPYLEWTDAELAACGLTPHPRGEQPASFTPQELAVATLVSQGMSNREAAAELVMSVKTVEYHLGHVFSKLGVRSRSQLTRKMFEVQPA